MSAAARIIIVSYNSAAYVNECIEHLLRQSTGDFEVVVVDNGSVDADAITLPDDGRFSLLKLPENVGFAAANNIGARGAQTPWIVTLNPDAFPRPGWLAALLEGARRHPDGVMFGSTQLFAHDPTIIDGEGDRYAVFGLTWRARFGWKAGVAHATGEVFSPCACAALYRRDAFEEAGGFDEGFFCYAEDIDLGFRLRLLGGCAYQIGDAVVHHVSSGITARLGDFTLYHNARNTVWTLVKNVPFPLILLTAPLYAAATLYLLLFRWKREDVPVVRRALRDALAGLGPVLAKRRAIQAGRRAPLCAIMRAMTWDPRAIRGNR